MYLLLNFRCEELCSCWSADPNSRPSASSLVDYFQVQKDDLSGEYDIYHNASHLEFWIIIQDELGDRSMPNKHIRLFIFDSFIYVWPNLPISSTFLNFILDSLSTQNSRAKEACLGMRVTSRECGSTIGVARGMRL